jgi:lipoate---protein ligase
LGEAWAEALGDGAEVHRGGMVHTAWSALVCFAGLGPGEVTRAGRKLVGISQRRTRDAARLQCAVYSTWDPGTLASVLRLEPADRTRLVHDLGSVVATTLPDLDSFLDRLARF